MKKFLLIGLIVGLVLIVIGGAGVVFAQVQGANSPTTRIVTKSQNGDIQVQPFGKAPGGQPNGNGIIMPPGGMMGRRYFDNNMGCMMVGRGLGKLFGNSTLRSYFISAFAAAVGLTPDQVNADIAKGETLAQIAIAQGKTQADLNSLWTQVVKDALSQAVTAKVLTQAQADQMLQYMSQFVNSGLGSIIGNCPMWNENSNNNKPNP